MSRPLITTAADLPPKGAQESLVVDFKATVPTDRPHRFDLAKDVAAFANAIGGSLIIGAREESGSRLADYQPLPTASADDIARAYEEAVRDRCRPKPLFACERIECGPLGVVLVVNVEPAMAQPVAVCVKKTEIVDERHSDESWCFPIRVGTQTAYLSPEVLAMYMLPEVRKTLILLAEIATDERIVLRRPLRNNLNEDRDAQFKDVVQKRNVVRLSNCTIALDRIESVYHDGSTWIIICPF